MKEQLTINHSSPSSPRGPRALSTLRALASLLCLLLLLPSCSDESERRQQRLVVEPYYAPFLQVEPMPTRSDLPTGYMLYSDLYPNTTQGNTSIALFMTHGTTSTTGNIVRLNSEGKWGTNPGFTIDQQQYYVYGFMPSEAAAGATVTPVGGDFSNGSTLTINGLATLTTADVCAVVAVAKGDDTHDIWSVGIELGQFGYEGTTGSDNKIFLLLKHLYAGLHLRTYIDAEYAKLRTIKVKEMKLTTQEKMTETINLTVTMTANDTGADPMGTPDYADAAGEPDYVTVTLFPPMPSLPEDPTEFEVPVVKPEDFLGCFAPGKSNAFVLTTKYDVYDKQGNLIRENCVANNQINDNYLPNIANLRAGEIYTIDLKIQPTYIYMLSEPDLDNPTITLE